MSYSGTGANRTPLGRINPVLLGRKRTDDSEPSLLSHHLRNREQSQSVGGYGNYDQYPQQSQQYDLREGQQYDQRGQQNYDQRTPHYNQGGQQQYDQRGQNQYHQRSNQQYDHRGPPPYERSNVQFDQRNAQHYDMRGNMQYDQTVPTGGAGHGYDQRAPPALPGPPNQGYDIGQRGYQPPDNTPSTPQRGPPVPMPMPPQPLMSANVGPPTPRSVGMPPQVGSPANSGQNGILGMPPSLSQGYGSAAVPPLPQGQPRPEPPLPSSYPKDIKKEPERDDSPARKKRKRSRWGDEEKKTSVPGMPATMPKNMTTEQTKQYLIHFKIEEIGMRLRTGDLGIPDNPEERSPSPEPIYNSEGKRLNTREFRVRKSLEEERHNLIQDAIKSNPDYKPPADYKPPSTRIQEKVMIPQDANPAINFIGLLIGPRGNTLKKMEKETNCKIIIRGKGSVKEGKVGRAGMPLPGEDEPLHALVTGPTHEDVKKAVNVISKIIKEGIETPEGSNELRKMQLRELAALNGTLIEEDMVRCRNCGSNEHRHWECTEQKNVTHAVVCTKCGGHGHIATDCVVTGSDSAVKTPSISERAKMDDEYMSLMAELGVDAPPGQGKPQAIPSGPSAPGKEFPAPQPPPPSSEAPWNTNSGSGSASWNYDKKDAHPSSQPAPPPLMSQNTAPGAFSKGHAWASTTPVPSAIGSQSTTGQVGNSQGNNQPGMPQPLMSIPGQPPSGQPPTVQPPSSAPQGLLPLMTQHGPPVVPGLATSTPAGAPPPPGIVAAPPPPPPPSSSSVISTTNTPVVQTGVPPWQTSAVPPWQAAPVPQQDPMAAFMPMMYPPMAPPVGITPPSATPLPPWMAAPPPPPPPPSS